MNNRYYEDSASPFFDGIDACQDEILRIMNHLQQLLDEIDGYHDKSLFFQNPEVIDGWGALVQAFENIEKVRQPEDPIAWEERTEPYITHLIKKRQLRQKYGDYLRAYHQQIKKLLDQYGSWLEGACVSTDGIGAISAGQYGMELKGMDDMWQFLAKLNDNSLKARFSIYTVLSDVYQLFIALMNRCGDILSKLIPSDDDFVKAIDCDLREWTRTFGREMFKAMKEELNRNYKAHRTDKDTPELWSEMLVADEEALNLAKRQELAKCDDAKQEHWGEDMKAMMDENGRLMQQILSSCHTDELLVLDMSENINPFIEVLTPDNIDVFYEIIVRRNLIQCQMFPELKVQHDAWLEKVNDDPGDGENSGLSAERQEKMDKIIGILRKGDWKHPATAENVAQWLNVVFGNDLSQLEKGDAAECEKVWTWVEGGRGDRVVIVSANLAGLLREEYWKKAGPAEISTILFGNNKQKNNISKGKEISSDNSKYKEVIPFLKKYMQKIISIK